MYHVLVLICFIFVSAQSHEAASRILYDLNLSNNRVVNVSTICTGISQPVGVEVGEYNGNTGVFVSSFDTNKIHFVDTSSGCEDTGDCTFHDVAGSGESGVVDGDFHIATISDPSRMLFLADLNMLVVMDRANGILRYLDMANRYVGTFTSQLGDKISVLGSSVADNNPELDIKVHGDYFYLSDSRFVYNLTGSDGTLYGALTAGVITQYSSLKAWQILNAYDISQHKIFIQSVAVNSKTNKLFVAYTYERSAIVLLPMECKDHSEIRVLSSDNVIYDIPRTFPKPRNGLLNSAPIESYALVTFPMHMVYVEADDVLYWVEVHSHMSNNKLGAVAVRRLRFTDEGTGLGECDCASVDCNCGEIDYYAGNEGTFRSFLGRSIGFRDGFSNEAEFRVPLTISVTSDMVGPVIYVADMENSAVRRVFTFVDTPSPTIAPTLSHKPSLSPTVSQQPSLSPTVQPSLVPTLQPSVAPSRYPMTASPTSSLPSLAPASSAPTVHPTLLPTSSPTSNPTYSHAPTKVQSPSLSPTALNGECLDVLLLDEFGDGWVGAALTVEHRGMYGPDIHGSHKRKPKPDKGTFTRGTDANDYFYSKVYEVTAFANPVRFSVCASLDAERYYERGLYTFEVRSVSGSKIVNSWEIYWEVVMSSGKTLIGSSSTSMTFDFTPAGIFTLVQSQNLVDIEASCQQCNHPPPKPKAKAYEPRKYNRRNLGTMNHKLKPKPSPIHIIPFVLHSQSGNGWTATRSFEGSVPTKFSISDSSKTQLISSGTMCDKKIKDNCEVRIPDGDYYFRVGGAGDENRKEVAWTFCRKHSSAQNELSFSIVGGQCIPGSLKPATEVGGTIEATTVTMRGELLLQNVFEHELSVTSTEILEEGIADILKISKSDVAIVYVCKTTTKSYCSEEWGVRSLSVKPLIVKSLPVRSIGQSLYTSNHRKLSETYCFNVVYIINIVAENFDVIGTRYKDVLNLSELFSDTLSAEFNKGSLETSMRSLAVAVESSQALSFVRVTSIVPPVETDLSYKFSMSSESAFFSGGKILSNEATKLVIDESLEQESLLVIPVVIVAIVIAVIVAVGHYRRNLLTVSGVETGQSTWRDAVLNTESLELSERDFSQDVAIIASDSKDLMSRNRDNVGDGTVLSDPKFHDGVYSPFNKVDSEDYPSYKNSPCRFIHESLFNDDLITMVKLRDNTEVMSCSMIVSLERVSFAFLVCSGKYSSWYHK